MQLKFPFQGSEKKQSKFAIQRKAVIKYLNKVNRPALIGEIAIDLKISLAEADTLLDEMSAEENPEIRLATEDELKSTDRKVAYCLTKASSAKLAHDP